MAAFHQHVAFSAFTGVVYGGALWYTDYVDLPVAAWASAMCTFGGVLPDLDSDSGKPLRETFHLLGTVGAILTLHRLNCHPIVRVELCLLAAIGVYFLLRYGAAALFCWLTVHRGMFHSLPAAILAGETAFLVYDSPNLHGRWATAIALALGYISHLVLDALWNLRVANAAASTTVGNPLKLFGPSRWANACCWSCLLAAGYLIAVQQHWFTPVEPYSPQVLRALELSTYSRDADHLDCVHQSFLP